MRAALALALACAAPAAPAAGEVVSADEGGMAVRESVSVAAAPAEVWAMLVTPARWWDPAHSWSGSAGNLSLDPRPGGCFCEKLPDGGGVEHLHVVFAAPGRMLRLTGALGPLQGEAVAGTMTIELRPAGAGTAVTLDYRLAGRRAGGFAAIAPAVDGVLAGQLARLKVAAERR